MENDNFNSEQDWARGTQYQSESYKRDSWNGNDALRDNEANPRQLLLDFIASIAVFAVMATLVVFLYDINYLSVRRIFITMVPSIYMMLVFLKKNNLKINKLETVILLFLNWILIYLMFHAIMARGVQKSLSETELSFWECCKFVNIMRHTESLKELYYTHFFWIMGVNIFPSILLLLVCRDTSSDNRKIEDKEK